MLGRVDIRRSPEVITAFMTVRLSLAVQLPQECP